MKYFFEAFMRLYPAHYRAIFGAEMSEVFNEARQERRLQGRGSYTAFLLAEFACLLTGALAVRSSELRRRPTSRAILLWLAFVAICSPVINQLIKITRFFLSLPPGENDLASMFIIGGLCIVFVAACQIVFVLNVNILARKIDKAARKPA